MRSSDWTPDENSAIVQSHLRMLLREWEGLSYNKSEERRALAQVLRHRSESSIEMKHRNISAVLLSYGIPPIYGYKPLVNSQSKLEDTLLAAIDDIPTFGKQAVKGVSATPTCIGVPILSEIEIPLVSIPWKSAASRRRVVKEDLLATEAQANGVHAMALEAVAKYEKEVLSRSGLKELAEKVVIEEYDERIGGGLVISRSSSGTAKTIVVKGTNSLAEYPFRVSTDEIDLSLDSSCNFRLYRVFGLRYRPRFFSLSGSLMRTTQVTSSEHTVLPRH